MAIVTKTYLSKCNTIVRDNACNMSLNPVMELNYGRLLTRGLIYFDHSKVKALVEDKTYPDISKLHHVLKMTNAASVRTRKENNCGMLDIEVNENKVRSAGFDLIYFLIPEKWDEGNGFDMIYDLYDRYHRSTSVDGCSWYQPANKYKWDTDGIYSTDRLSNELDLFTSKKGNLSTVIIGYQHYEHGNEPLEFDITETFNKFITGELQNYGIGIAFSPQYENETLDYSEYVAYFTQHTTTFYEPYVETTYDEYIKDDRSNFYLDKDNRLYFYASVGGNMVNLDNIPACDVNGIEYEAKQATKGVYYIELNLSSEEYEADTMYYDTWKNLNYNGKAIKDTELSFVTKASDGYFSFGLPSQPENSERFTPSLHGINFKEQIKQGDIRKVHIECRVPYSTAQKYSVDNLEYRLYAKQGERQIDVISYRPVEIGYNSNFFYVNTQELLPSRYYIDIKIKYDKEEIYHKDILEFDIVSDATVKIN